MFRFVSQVIQLAGMVSTESYHLLSGKKTLIFSLRPTKSFPLSLTQMKIRVPRTLAFASAKGKGKAESGVEAAIVGDNNTSTERNWSFDFPESKAEFCLVDSEACQNLSSVLEKLNALRSHLLAAEKWNASRLQSCDRSV